MAISATVFEGDVDTPAHTDLCPDENDVLAYVEGALSPTVRASLEGHVHACAGCRRLLAFLGAPPDERAPPTLGRYEIRRRLGRGGMGIVYAAYDPRLDRDVAVKALAPQREGNPIRRASLFREASIMARVSHPNVVQVFDVGSDGDRVFVAMELVEGATLEALLAKPIPWPRAQKILLEIAAGVEAAHAVGVVHRDLKPGNVLVRPNGPVAVSDFGLAGWHGDDDLSASTLEPDHGLETPTFRGAGTPPYMAPEQHRHQPSDVRTDVFAFCVLAYRMVYGELPFAASDPELLLQHKLRGELVPPRRSGAPHWVRAVILRGLAPDPVDRWPSMTVLRARLHGPRRRLLVIGAVVAAGIAAGLYDPRPSLDCSPADEVARAWIDAQPDLARHFETVPPDSHRRTHAAIDDYVHRWSDAWRASCEDEALDPRVAEGRLACLEPARAALGSLWASLRGHGSEVVYGVPSAVRSLPSLDACADARPDATSPDLFAEQARIRGALARSDTLMALGNYAEAEDEVAGLALAARRADLRRLEAAVHLQIALLATNRGDAGAAASAAEAAYALAVTVDDAFVATRAAASMARSAGAQGRPDAGERWLRHAEAAAQRLPAEHALDDDLHIAAMLVAHARGDLQTARVHAEQAVAALQAEVGDDAWEVGPRLNDLANIHLLLRSLPEARRHAEHGLRLVEAAFGSNHPQAANLRGTMANVEIASGNTEAAIDHLRAADEVYARSMGPHEGNRLMVAVNLGALELARGRWEAGRAALLPVLAEAQRRVAETSESYIGVLSNVAVAELELGMLESARERFERVLQLRRQREGDATAGVAEAMMHLGLVDLAEGELEPAARQLEEARRIYAAAVGPEHPPIAGALEGLARVALARGDAPAARELVTRALDLRHDEPAKQAPLQALLREVEAAGAASRREIRGGGFM